MQIDPRNPSVHSAGRKNRTRRKGGDHGQNDRVERGQSHGNHKVYGPKGPNTKGRKYLRDNPQFHDGVSYGSIAAAGSGGLQGSVAVAQLKYPDGRWNLKALASKILGSYGLAADYPKDVQQQVADIMAQVRPSPGVYNLPEAAKKPWVRDMRHIPMMSVDNGTLWTKMDPAKLAADPEANVSSRDIDQLQGAQRLPNGDIKVWVAVSDVDAFVPKGSAVDKHMDVNTSSIYTPDKVFNLIPPELAEDVISLNPREDRLATIIEYTVSADGRIKDEDVYQGIVNSQAKLDYASVGGWLEGNSQPSPGMQIGGQAMLENLQLQSEAAQRIDAARGSVDFESNEKKIITENGDAVRVEDGIKNLATSMVENLMVTSNSVMSRFLRSKGYPTLERVVLPPEKWDQIVEVAAEHKVKLPNQPDSRALNDFLVEQRRLHPEESEELSFTIIKLIGRGSYQAVMPDEPLPGHFALGADNYSQCTASIRRGGDRIIARLLKAALAGEPSPYSADELRAIAENLSEKERVVQKAERAADKAAVATMLEDRIGETFRAVVSGVKDGMVWCRIGNPPCEGKLEGLRKARVGQKLQVELSSVNVERGWIDFDAVR
ncbi:MAG: RNB domain-containing ribonuclease [Vulcanimicrobiota bacterium]